MPPFFHYSVQSFAFYCYYSQPISLSFLPPWLPPFSLSFPPFLYSRARFISLSPFLASFYSSPFSFFSVFFMPSYICGSSLQPPFEAHSFSRWFTARQKTRWRNDCLVERQTVRLRDRLTHWDWSKTWRHSFQQNMPGGLTTSLVNGMAQEICLEITDSLSRSDCWDDRQTDRYTDIWDWTNCWVNGKANREVIQDRHGYWTKNVLRLTTVSWWMRSQVTWWHRFSFPLLRFDKLNLDGLPQVLCMNYRHSTQ